MLALLMLAFLLRVVALDAQGLWADEMATVVISERDWAGVIKWVIDDRVHPPLYYLLTSPWMALGRGEAWLRYPSAMWGYPSAMWGVLATALGYALGKRLHGRRVGVTGAALLVLSPLLLCLSPLLLWHSRDARMYAMLTALTIGSSYFFVRLWDGARRRDWVGYVIFSLMAVYTHHFAVWIMLAQFVFIALARRHYPQALKAWTLGAGLVGMLYAPWILTILSGEGLRRAGISWVPAAGLLDPLWTLFTFLLGHSADPFNPVFYLAFLPALGLLAFAVIRFFGEREASLGYLLAWLFVPLAMVWIISLDWPLPEKRAIYMDRFMIGQMPAFLLLIAWGLERLARCVGNGPGAHPRPYPILCTRTVLRCALLERGLARCDNLHGRTSPGTRYRCSSVMMKKKPKCTWRMRCRGKWRRSLSAPIGCGTLCPRRW